METKEQICPACQGCTPTLFEKPAGIANGLRESGPVYHLFGKTELATG